MDREELRLANELAELVVAGDRDRLSERLPDMHPADVAWAIRNLPAESRALVLELLSDEAAAVVLLELDQNDQVDLLRILGADRSRSILSEMGADDIADILGDVTAGDVDEVLSLLEQEDVADVRRLLDYPEESAGGIMTTEYVSLLEAMTAEEAIQYLRQHAPDAETVYYVYVVDKQGTLVGVLSLRDLIIAPVTAELRSIMQSNVIKMQATEDQEEVANTVARYDLLAVPIVDNQDRLLGIVTVDDVIDVLEEEATEDIHRMGGTFAGEDEIDLPLDRIKKRLPWLVILLFGSMLGASVLRSFTQTLESVVILAYFIPVLIDMDGNVGIQSLVVTVRALATRGLDIRKVWSILLREAQVGLALGIVCGSLVTVVAYVWQGNLYLGAVVGVSMAVTMMVAALLGTVVPLLFDRLGVDAAVASGPFITTLADVTGLLIYFSLATWLLKFVAL